MYLRTAPTNFVGKGGTSVNERTVLPYCRFISEKPTTFRRSEYVTFVSGGLRRKDYGLFSTRTRHT